MPSNTSAIFNPVEFYNLAAWLYQVKPSSSEQSLKRTIIGRAYYAALLSGSDKTGTPTTGTNSHQNIINAVKNLDSQAGNNLKAMNLLRRKADYEKLLVNDRDVQISLRESRKILEVLGFIAPNDPGYTIDYLDKSKFIVPCSSPIAPNQ